ncbi:MAG: signal peptide peptidase SppA [Candidatus Saganbacteria bacterium]|nr:signal peptide peptidase SppA [Candidatus Saganbacteria bacterium]
MEGTKIIAFIEASGLGVYYYLATVADKIVAPSGSMVGGLGRSIAVTKVKELMNKIGVNMQIIAKGKYKVALSPFSQDLTDEQRAMVEGIVSESHRLMLTDIAKDRKTSIEKLKNIGDGSIFSASQAKELGLVDEIGYFKDAKELASALAGGKGEARMIDRALLAEESDGYMGTQFTKIAVIEVDGDIVTGKSSDDILFGGRRTGADSVSEQIKKAADDPWVKAIVLRVNSPGGSSVASGQIYNELLKAKEKDKVIVASMGDVAASGGYYISCPADKIIADPGTITGSIGVVMSLPELSELYKKIGVKTEVIKEGNHADMFSGLRKLTPEERKSLEDNMNETYDEFKGAVSKGRGMTTEEVSALAEGRIYTGNQAKEAKLVDALGGLSDAIDSACDLAKIRGEPRIVYYIQNGYTLDSGGILEMMQGFKLFFSKAWGSGLKDHTIDL